MASTYKARRIAIIPLTFMLFLAGGCETPSAASGTDGDGDGINFVTISDPLPWRHSSYAATPLIEARGDIVLANGSFISRDAGRSWRRLNPQLGQIFSLSFVDDQSAILHSSGLGIAMFRFDTDVVTSMNAPGVGQLAYRAADRTLYVVGQTQVYRWRDGAWTQKAIGTPVPTHLVGVSEGPSPTLYSLGDFHVYASDDEGATWQPRSERPYLGGWPMRFTSLPGGGMIIAGETFGLGQRSTDGGRTWTTIHFPAGEHGGSLRVGDDDGALYLRMHRSRDGGQTWQKFFDHEALGLSEWTTDLARYTRGRFYVNLHDAGFFRTTSPVGRLEYAGAFDRAPVTVPVANPTPLLGVPLPGGDALTGIARYDAATRTWLWHTAGLGGGVRIIRLRDGRLAAHTGLSVRFSSDEGRSWGPSRNIWSSPQIGRYRFRVAGPMVQTADGRLFSSARWEFCSSGEACPNLGTLAVSADLGASWTPAAMVEDTAQQPNVWAMAASGNVLYGFGVRSRDGGRTWEPSPARHPLGALSTGEIIYTNDASDEHILRLLGRDGTSTRVLGAMKVEGQPADGRGLSMEIAYLTMGSDDRAYAFCGDQVCRTEHPIR